MRAKRCLILAAGFGTRMGPIGKRLPKVMWPVYGQSLLELQVRFARRLGYQDIYINLFHQSEEILARAQHRDAFDGVTWLVEKPEILDIGGGIHNLARRPEVSYQGELLVLNADQFLWFTAQDLERWKKSAGEFDSLLLTWQVNTSQGYNQLSLDEHRRFLGVIPNANLPRDQLIETYSGNSLIRLEGLDPQTGPSAFFHSVCPPGKRVQTALLNRGRYWDFGTAQRYHHSMRGVLRAVLDGEEDEFVNFLIETGAFDPRLLSRFSGAYGCEVKDLINLSGSPVAASHPPGVILEGASEARGSKAVVVFQGEVQELS